MAATFDLELADSEEVIYEGGFQASAKTEPFAMAITSEAVHVLRKKLVAMSEPYHVVRIPKGGILAVELRRAGLVWRALIASVLGAAAATALLLMIRGNLAGVEPEHYGIVLALLAGSIVLPFVVRQRLSLVIVHEQGTYRWRPPILVDQASRREVQELLDGIIGACRQLGLRVVDERGREEGSEAVEPPPSGRGPLQTGRAVPLLELRGAPPNGKVGRLERLPRCVR